MSRGSEGGVFGAGIETGTGLGSKVTMTTDSRAGIAPPQIAEKGKKSLALSGCARISRIAIAIKTTNVGDANRAVVMPQTVSANHQRVTPGANGAVKKNKIMITDSLETTETMITGDVGERKVATGGSCSAMHDNF